MTTSSLLSVRGQFDDASWLARARTRTLVLAAAGCLVCALVMIEWFARSDLFLDLGPSASAMAFDTALAFGLLGASLLARHTVVRRVLLGLSLLIGVLVGLEYLLDASFGIDELFVNDWTATDTTAHPGRPAETSTICMTLLAGAAVLLEVGWHRTCQLAATVALVIAMLTGFAYLYGGSSVAHVGPYQTMAVGSVLAVLTLSVAILLAVPHGAAQWISYGKDTGADLQRILIPLAVVVIPWVGWLALRGEREGFFANAFGTALLITVIVTLVLIVGYWVGRHSLRLDREREELLGELHKVNLDLEENVRSRSHQLNRQRTKLALLEERDRIARDLHDRVIQRIFAAGLQVGALSRTAGKASAATGDEAAAALAVQLDTVATELDLAIRELRNSIFELTSIDDHDDIEQVVRDIVARASRILGFMPRVEVTGEIAGFRADIVANVASVVQEALSNIARHARASSAEVSLHATQHQVRIRITDDGIGLPDPLPRSSGISNLMNRARNLGGTATWAGNEPKGTVFTWQVPRDGAPATTVDDDLDVSELSAPDGAAV